MILVPVFICFYQFLYVLPDFQIWFYQIWKSDRMFEVDDLLYIGACFDLFLSVFTCFFMFYLDHFFNFGNLTARMFEVDDLLYIGATESGGDL